MSKFASKVLKGERPTDEDWNEHLIEAHKTDPGMTPDAFNPLKDPRGLNSYEVLTRTIEPHFGKDANVIDLACGDGHLIPYLLAKLGPNAKIAGIDMSEGELEVARRNVRDPRVEFHLAKAQQLPAGDHSADYILSHMAFMLMLPVEPVVQELARVLKTGGKFSAVIGSRNSTGFYREIQKAKFEFIDGQLPNLTATRTGDPRVKSPEGLDELFNARTGFSGVESISDFELKVETDPEGIWHFNRNTYFVSILPEPAKQELREILVSLGKSAVDRDGKVTFHFPMRVFTALRA